jgi:outer membrane protein assembly factor BamB
MFYGIDAVSGVPVWRAHSGGTLQPRTTAEPENTGDLFYELDEAWLYAHDLSTGEPIWEYTSGEDSLILSYDVVASSAFVGSVAPRWAEGERRSEIVRLDAMTGEPIWRASVGSGWYYLAGYSPTGGGRVYAGGESSAVALDARSGVEHWRLDVPKAPQAGPGEPTSSEISHVLPAGDFTFVTTRAGDIFAIAES